MKIRWEGKGGLVLKNSIECTLQALPRTNGWSNASSALSKDSLATCGQVDRRDERDSPKIKFGF